MVFRNARVFGGGRFCPGSLFVSEDGKAMLNPSKGELFLDSSAPSPLDEASELFSGISVSTFGQSNLIIIPGFSDVHVHLREPGFSYKETVKTGTLAAASAGYTVVCTMPNLKPAPDSLETLKKQLEIIEKDATITVLPYGTITKGEQGKELSDMEAMAEYVIGFSDDGKGVQNEEIMFSAMRKAKSLGKPIVAHCEDESLLNGGVIHAGRYASEHKLPGICSESEYLPIKRDLALVEKTECKYHVCHISTKESVELIRQGKKKGLPVTCETAPHYLMLCEDELQDDGSYKMNPPLRSRADREALLEGICDGTIDVIATDHAPHTKEEKSKGLLNSSMGITGIECAFPVLYTELVLKKKLITLEKLIDLMSTAPDRIFGLEKKNDFAVIDLSANYRINPDKFISKGKVTPFAGMEVFGKNILTVKDGKVIWRMTER